ncbi:hypothetical protein CspeluHIS016_0101550 [Cutaneotrichosporon spelunceum]|uniref:F-box domain-containing protein n=1 Tax=Cutaneotrichosporon spelunceum TaxID=1672016 RepID=A0AAD3TN70_9TREE|nr:hypothetical protein CspeluHIS016_0101550 [Cutaneotrichosporon spelunceum]
MSVHSALVTWNIAQVAMVAVHASFVLTQPAPSSAQLALVPTHALLAVLLSPGLLPPIDDPPPQPKRVRKGPPPAPSTPRKPRIVTPDTPPLTPTSPKTPRRRPPATPTRPISPWRPTVTPQPYTRVRRALTVPRPLPTLDLESVVPYLDYADLLALRAVSREYRVVVDAHLHRALQLAHVGSRARGRSLAPRTWGRIIPRLNLPRSLSQPSPVRALHIVNGTAPLRVLRGLDVLRVGPVQHVTHPAPTTIVMAPPRPRSDRTNPTTDTPPILVVQGPRRGPRHILRLSSSSARPQLQSGTVSTVLRDDPVYDGQPKLLDDWARAIARNLPGRVFTLVGSEGWHPLWLAAGHGPVEGKDAVCNLRLRFVAEITRLARALHDWGVEETAQCVEKGLRFVTVAEYCSSVGRTQYDLETRW